MNKEFWIKAGIRALHTMAQAALAYIGTAAVMSEVNWTIVVSAAAISGFFRGYICVPYSG